MQVKYLAAEVIYIAALQSLKLKKSRNIPNLPWPLDVSFQPLNRTFNLLSK